MLQQEITGLTVISSVIRTGLNRWFDQKNQESVATSVRFV